MKLTKRILSAVLAASMLLAVMLTGCSTPKLTIGGTADVAGVVGGKEITTGDYLAYLYLTFEQIYMEGGYAYYEYYGMNPWEQQIPYGEGEDAPKVSLSEFITLQTKDAIVRQEALRQMMAQHNISWIAEEEKKIDDEAAKNSGADFTVLGFSNEKYLNAYKNMYLNERSLFYGLYGEGGERAVNETELKKYYEENYLCYKYIPIALTDKDGKELDEKGKAPIMERLNKYLDLYSSRKDFEFAMDNYTMDEAGDKEIEADPAEDENTRNLQDKKDMDADLVKAIESVKVGEAKIVTYKAGGKTPTAALVLRLDLHDKEQFKDSNETLLSTVKYDEFDKEITEAAKKIVFEFDESVIEQCKPENFLTDGQ